MESQLTAFSHVRTNSSVSGGPEENTWREPGSVRWLVFWGQQIKPFIVMSTSWKREASGSGQMFSRVADGH